MQIATIVPTPHLNLTKGDPYQMVLAHHAGKDITYQTWFADPLRSGHRGFRILDNGAAELSEGIDAKRLARLARFIQPDEVVLPDVVGDSASTLSRAQEALPDLHGLWGLMAVPQGRSRLEYLDCLNAFLCWPEVTTIGISRFVVNEGLWESRFDLLQDAPGLVSSDKEIHLLGSPGDPIEAFHIERAFPSRIRGIDSGIAAIYTQAGKRIDRTTKPEVDLDFSGSLDPDLLMANIVGWKNRVRQGVWW